MQENRYVNAEVQSWIFIKMQSHVAINVSVYMIYTEATLIEYWKDF